MRMAGLRTPKMNIRRRKPVSEASPTSGRNANGLSWPAITFVTLVGLMAVSFFYSPGTVDVGLWGDWIREISAYGLIGGFAHTLQDYPPLAWVLLAAVSRCAQLLGTDWFLVLKGSLLLFLFATCGCFYWFTRNLILAAALESTLLLNSVALGYLDIYFAPFLIAALFHLQRGNLNRGILLFAISCFIKWQPLIIAPFVCIYVIGTDGQREHGKLWSRISPFVISMVTVALPVAVAFGPAVLTSLYLATRHGMLSGNALNLSWLYTWALHLFQPYKYGALREGQIDLVDATETIVKLEKILFYASYGMIFVAFALQTKTFKRLIVYSMAGYMAYFILNTGVHENHLFLVCCLAWILAFVDSDCSLNAISLSIAANANLVLFYGVFGQPLPFPRVVAGVDITLWFAVANVCLFAGLLLQIFKTDGVGARIWNTVRHLLRS
jgi:hypothetical protein